jgi:hypothetical protein
MATSRHPDVDFTKVRARSYVVVCGVNLVEAGHLSITGLISFAVIVRFIASNIRIEPTEMPCTSARRARISPGLSSVAGPLNPPSRQVEERAFVIAQTRFISCGFPGGVLSISCPDSYASSLPKGSGPMGNNHGVASVSRWRQDAPEVRVQICALIASQEKAIRRPLSVRQRWTPFSDFFGLNLTVPPTDAGRSLSKSAASRHFVALSGARWVPS